MTISMWQRRRNAASRDQHARVVTESTADLTWSLLCSVARRIAEGDRYIRAGKWRDWTLLLMAGSDIHGRTLGICGMGRIGQAVARRAQGFHMRILYHNRQRLESTSKPNSMPPGSRSTRSCSRPILSACMSPSPATRTSSGQQNSA
jgi:hypothetical protein